MKLSLLTILIKLKKIKMATIVIVVNAVGKQLAFGKPQIKSIIRNDNESGLKIILTKLTVMPIGTIRQN